MPSYQIRPDRERPDGWQVLKIAGIPFYIEPSFLFFVGIIIFYNVNNGAPLAEAGLLGFIIFFSLLIHEAGHALAARLLGYRDIAVSLVMFGGYTTHPGAGRGHSLLIVLAGPLATFAIIVLTARLNNHFVRDSAGAANFFLREANWLNWVWLIFNMLPIYPLDGGQALYYLLNYVTRQERALTIIAIVSMITCALAGVWAYQRSIVMVIFMVMFAFQNYQILRSIRG